MYKDSDDIEEAFEKQTGNDWIEAEQNEVEQFLIDELLKAHSENFVKYPVSGSAVLNELLTYQIEVLCSPVRFNGVHIEDIKSVFEKHGVKYESPF